MKKLRLTPRRLRPKPGPLKLTSFSQEGLTTFHLIVCDRHYGFALKGDSVTPMRAFIALAAFARTIKKEMIGGRETHQ